MGKISGLLKNIFLFQEPKESQEHFILKEYNEGSDENTDQQNNTENESKTPKPTKKEDHGKIKDKEPKKKTTKLEKVSPKLDENIAYLKVAYSIPLSTDVMIREFDITLEKKTYKAFIIFIDGLTEKPIINKHILAPLMLYTSMEKSGKVDDVIRYIERNIITQNQLKKTDDYKIILGSINFGECVLFVDEAKEALVFDVKSWEHRTVDRPNTEITIRGPQEAFGETVRTNTALVRKNLKNENLIVENIVIGERSNTSCSLMYLKNLANPSLVEEVRKRVSSLKLDYANDSGIVEQLIEDSTFMSTPQIIATERPDRVSSMLSEGKVAILVDGNPFVLVVPSTFFDFIHSPEDLYVRFPYGNLMRFIRYLAIFAALLLPGIYVAITTYHHEMIPTDLLLAISGARERVPFPTVIEILIMEISFELIREAGIRMPAPIGPTLGIIGALILGQAAVSANIVSPILIIIVAVTGIGTLAIPNFALAFAFRILRFAYIGLGALAGLLGITLGLFIQGLFLVSQKSFGVPFFAPFAPKTSGGMADALARAPTWKQEKRPDYINPLDVTKQPKISRGWTKKSGKKEGQK